MDKNTRNIYISVGVFLVGISLALFSTNFILKKEALRMVQKVEDLRVAQSNQAFIDVQKLEALMVARRGEALRMVQKAEYPDPNKIERMLKSGVIKTCKAEFEPLVGRYEKSSEWEFAGSEPLPFGHMRAYSKGNEVVAFFLIETSVRTHYKGSDSYLGTCYVEKIGKIVYMIKESHNIKNYKPPNVKKVDPYEDPHRL